MLADRNTWCPFETCGLAIERAFNFTTAVPVLPRRSAELRRALGTLRPRDVERRPRYAAGV